MRLPRILFCVSPPDDWRCDFKLAWRTKTRTVGIRRPFNLPFKFWRLLRRLPTWDGYGDTGRRKVYYESAEAHLTRCGSMHQHFRDGRE
jgi:hypothetical protein